MHPQCLTFVAYNQALGMYTPVIDGSICPLWNSNNELVEVLVLAEAWGTVVGRSCLPSIAMIDHK